MLLKKHFRSSLKDYLGVKKFLWDLVEGQKKNIAQLVRIKAIVNTRWSLKKDLWDSKEDNNSGSKKDNNGGSKEDNNGGDKDKERSIVKPKEIDREMLGGTLSSVFC